jgi:hypothetical protein
MAIGKTTVADGYITMPEAKFAAIIRHFGIKFTEGSDEECYMLEFPLKDWANVPKGTRVLCADGAHGASVGFTCFVENPVVSTRGDDTGDC